MLEFLRMAARVAVQKTDSARNFYLGAVAIRRDQAIVRSSNGCAYIPFPKAHAEARVLQKAGFGATIYVSRVSRLTGKLTLARPCNNCYRKMMQFGVRKCYYSIDETEYGIISFGNNHTERIKKIIPNCSEIYIERLIKRC